MKITSISSQIRNSNRVNVSVDGKYRFSLDCYQVTELGLRVGDEYEESDLASLEQESQFGKIYSRTLEYCLIRPRSEKEIREYLYRKNIPRRDRLGNIKPGIPKEITDRVIGRLTEKKYIDDQVFATFWIENRSITKGSSQRKLIAELKSKGISDQIIDIVTGNSNRSDEEEIKKIIIKKRSRYPDDQKFITYLSRLGFSYDDIKKSLDMQ